MPTTPAPVRRFVALGDSFTEGLHDDLGADGRHRGWADRTAAALAGVFPGLEYANLAVRGRLLDQVVAAQLAGAVAMRPDLVSFHAGPNDVLRPGVDVAGLVARHAAAVTTLRAGGARVIVFTVIGRAAGRGRLIEAVGRRFDAFNDGVRVTASAHGAVLVDLAAVAAMRDPRLWHEDRLHLVADGHARVAAAVLEALALGDAAAPGIDPRWWRRPLPAAAAPGRRAAVAGELRWMRRHLLPWVWRRVRGVSSGDAIASKRPDPAEVRPPRRP